MKLTLGNIHDNGFIKQEYESNSIVHHRLSEVRFHSSKDTEDSLAGSCDIHYDLKDMYLSHWKKWGLNIHNVTFRTRKILPGSCVELHTDMAESQYKAIIFCPKEKTDGAKFVYGKTDGKLESYQPKFGEIMFLKTGDPNFVYGFTTLKSNEPVYYLEFYGAINTKKPIEDQFYSHLSINKYK